MMDLDIGSSYRSLGYEGCDLVVREEGGEWSDPIKE